MAIIRAASLIGVRRGKPYRPILSSNDPINRGLIGCWLLGDAGAKGLTVDISGYQNHGVLTGTPKLAPSHHGGMAHSFDGSAGFVSIPAAAILSPVSGITISVWVKFNSLAAAYSAVFSWVSGTTAYHQILVKSTGKLAMYVNAGGQVSYDGGGSHTLVTGQWYRLQLSYNAALGLIGYVNGVQDGTGGVHPLGLSTASVITTIGKDANTAGRFVNGMIEGARQWNRFLSSAERSRLDTEPYSGILEIARRRRVSGQSASARSQAYAF